MATSTPDTVTVTFDPQAVNLQADIIFAATSLTAGIMSASQAGQITQLSTLSASGFGPLMFSNATRPLPNDPQFADALAAGRVGVIWNSTDKQPNYTDGVNWYDADGNVT